MKHDSLTLRQGQCLLMIFIFGSSIILGVSSGSGNDTWVALLLGMAMSLPIFCLYARLMKLYPEMDLYEIMEQLFGKGLSKILTALMSWYAIHLGSLVLRNFAEFIEITAMPETPQLPVMVLMAFITIYLARSGLRTIGKWAVPMLVFILSIVAFTVLASINKMEFTNIKPMFSHSVGSITKNTVQIIGFPFCEAALFLLVVKGVKKQDSPYRLYIVALLFSAIVLLIVMLRNLFVLGPAMQKIEYFPSYAAARVIEIGNFLTRIEGFISLNFIVAGIGKITVCLLVASRGIAYVTGVQNHKNLIVPMGMFAVALSSIIYQSTMERFIFLRQYYWVYTIPFQLLIPMAVWIAAEIKNRKNKKGDSNSKVPVTDLAAGD